MRLVLSQLSFSLALGSLSMASSSCIIESSRSDLYASCRETDDCEPVADACYTVAWDDGHGGMCSRDCVDDQDCPGWAACYALEGDRTERSICYARCEANIDCRSGFRCTNAIIGDTIVDSICMPR